MTARQLDFRTDCILTPNSKRRESRRKLSVLSRLSMLHSKKQVANAVACLGFAFLTLYIIQVAISFIKYSSGVSVTVLLVTLVLSVLFLPEDPFYPSLKYGWRLFTGLVVFCNLCNLYALLCVHDVDSYSRDIRRVFPQSNQAISSRTEYGVDCSPVTWTKIYSHLDIFAVAHLVGCAFKAIIFRQFEILWIYSFVWELTEYCFAHLLPNFAECWWDRVLLDVLICNGLGYYIGVQFCKMNSLPMFDWHSEWVTQRLATLCCLLPRGRRHSAWHRPASGTASDQHVSAQVPTNAEGTVEGPAESTAAAAATHPLSDSAVATGDARSRRRALTASPADTTADQQPSRQSRLPPPPPPSSSMSVALAIFLGLFVGQVSELNTFLYKHFFAIPSHTHLMAARTTFCAIIPIPFIANLFAMTRGQHTLTLHSKLVLLLTATDSLFSVKFGLTTFPSLDLAMVTLWIAVTVGLTFVCVLARSVRAVVCREYCCNCCCCSSSSSSSYSSYCSASASFCSSSSCPSSCCGHATEKAEDAKTD